jgi:hypothetical protein
MHKFHNEFYLHSMQVPIIDFDLHKFKTENM